MDRYKASKLVQMIGAHGWKKVLAGQADVVAVSPGESLSLVLGSLRLHRGSPD